VGEAGSARDGGPARPKKARPHGGVSVIAGGLLQDLEDRLRRDLAPIEERVRAGEEIRGLAGAGAADPGGMPVVVLPSSPLEPPAD